MLYLSSILKSPYTGALKSEDNSATIFTLPFENDKIYRWSFSRALNEENGFIITEFDNKSISTLLMNGLIDNPEGRFFKFSFDFRVRFLNGTDFSLATSTLTTSAKHLVIDKRVTVKSEIEKFIFQPFKDIVYVQINVKDMIKNTSHNPITLKIFKLGFSIVNNG